MEGNMIYSLDINYKGNHQSFDFETKQKAVVAFKFISEKFNSNMVERNKDNYSQEIIQLTTSDVHTGTVSGAMASFAEEEWFTGVYNDMIIAAEEYHKINK
jgi:hypothetical protein